MAYNLREKINHIGYCSNQIVATNNLPSIKQLLAVLFYNLRRVSKTLRESALLTVQECLIIWKKARIPTQEEKKCIIKLENEYERWRKIQKNTSRRSDTQIRNEKEYEESINKLFDIAHADAMIQIKDDNDKQFLRDQRELSENRNSATCSNSDNNESMAMEVDKESSSIVENASLANIDDNKVVNTTKTLDKYDPPRAVSKDLLDEVIGQESESPNFQCTPPVKRRATQVTITAKLAAALDKCKTSKRNAMHLLMAAAEAFGVDTRNLILNTTSILQAREKLRKERYEGIKLLAPSLFSNLPSTIHWDGKMLPGYLRREIEDRIAIIITCGEVEQLLAVPQISSSTGANQANAVFETLTDWSLLSNIEALCCDSTSSNTGRSNGACVLLEGLIGKDLLYLICRHHMYELVLKSVFEIKFGKSTGPEVTLFKRFGDFWKFADQENYEPGISDVIVNTSLEDMREQILSFCLEHLETDLERCDYKEFLELVIIFLGGTLPDGITFHPPGAIHHARWMAKAIYSLKMYIFRTQFLLDEELRTQCRDVCIFIIRVYVQAWFHTSIPTQAPNQDLIFLKTLYAYKNIDKSISDGAIKKFRNHLWYLVPELAALGFFDSTISVEEKLKMCEALKSDNIPFGYGKRILATDRNVSEIINANVSDFICQKTYRFFERLKIDTTFLTKHPSKWAKDRGYIHGLKVVTGLRVVNDTAERGVKLVTEFNNLLTKDSKQSQYLLAVIKDYQSLFPNSNKETLMQSYV